MATVNLYETRTMMRVLRQMKPARSFFRNTFFGPFGTGQLFQTEHIDIDIVRGTRRMAPFVNPKHEGKLVESQGYETWTYKPPYIKPKLVTTAEDFQKRMPGEFIYGPGMTA